MENLSGQKISEKEEKEIINFIRKLEPKQIDDLFYNCGWIETPHDNNKSLPNSRIKQIKDSQTGARNLIKVFLLECDINEIKKEIKRLDKK